MYFLSGFLEAYYILSSLKKIFWKIHSMIKQKTFKDDYSLTVVITDQSRSHTIGPAPTTTKKGTC